MRTLFKICIAAGCILLAAGLAITACGARSAYNTQSPAAGTPAENSTSNLAITPENGIRDVEISISRGDLSVSTGDTYAVEMGSEAKKYCRFSIENGVFRLIDSRVHIGNNWNFFNNTLGEEDTIRVVLPVSQDGLRDVEISLGMGRGDIKELTAQNLDLDAGVGKVSLDNLSLENLDFSGGVGSMEARGLSVSKECRFEAGVGEYDIAGDLRGDVRIDGGIGKISLDLMGLRTDYQVSVSSGLGSTQIDSERLGFMSDYNDTSHAENRLNVECGVGDVDIRFGGQRK